MNSANNIFNRTLPGKNSNVQEKIEFKIQRLISPIKKDLTENSSESNNESKNITEIKVNFNKDKNNIIREKHSEKYINDKIVYIQRWWKILNKIIIIQKNVRTFLRREKKTKVLNLMKMIYKLCCKKTFLYIREKRRDSENNQEYLNEINKNIKKNIIKKIKKYETSTKFNKRKNVKSDLLFHDSSMNKFLLTKKLKDAKKTRNDNLKSFYSINELNSLNSMTINKENTTYILLNNDNNNMNKVYKEKENYKIKNDIFNKEKLKVCNDIFNIYNNVKKIYKNNNKNNINQAKYSTSNDFHKNRTTFKFNNNKDNKKIKNKKLVNRNIIINKNNNINVNININDYLNKEINKKHTNYELKKFFIYWKEILEKKRIIEKLKSVREKKSLENELFIYKNRLKDKNKKNEFSSITTKKINISNSVVGQRIKQITPRKLNQKRENNIINKKLNKNNYNEKKSKMNSSINKNKKYYNQINEKKGKKCFSNEKNQLINKQKGNSNYKKENNCKNNLELDNKEKIYNIIKLLERKNNNIQLKKFFDKWKMLIKLNINNTKGIEEKIINFKEMKSPCEFLNNSTLNIFRKSKNIIYENNKSQNNFYQTESNINIPNSHIRNNSIIIQRDILSSSNFSKEKFNKLNINIKSPKIVYRKKLLFDGKNGNKFINFNKERNLTIGNNFSDLDILNKTRGNFFDFNDYKNRVNNSIYGGKFYKGYNRIEEREICFTPNKNNNFKNNFGKNINVVENYLNKEISLNETENNNFYKKEIKIKRIFFLDKNRKFNSGVIPHIYSNL